MGLVYIIIFTEQINPNLYGANMSLYNELRAKKIYTKMNVIRRLNNEIDVCFATILITIFLKLNFKPNTITFISVIVTYLSVTILLIFQNNYTYLLLIVLYTIHSWDYADGEVARRTNSTSLYGHLLDESATTTIRNTYYLWVGVYLISFNNTFWTSLLVILLIFLRLNSYKNPIYRIALIKFNIRKINSESINQILSVNKKLINNFKKGIDVLRLNDFRIIVLTIALHMLFNIDFIIYTIIILINLQLIRNIWDFLWLKNKGFLNDFFIE